MHPSRSRRSHHDPTSVAARKLQAKQKQAHRIKLRKQLEKARHKLGLSTRVRAGAEAETGAEAEAGSRLELETGKTNNLLVSERERRAGRGVSASSTKITFPDSTPLVATSGPARTSKPNPLKRALDRREERQEEMRLAAEQRNQEIKAREEARASKIRERERLQKKLSARTRTGQPRLFKHIDVLLEKIEKSGN